MVESSDEEENEGRTSEFLKRIKSSPPKVNVNYISLLFFP